MNLKIENIINHLMDENTYFLHEEGSLFGILIDPGIDKIEIEKFLNANNFIPKFILITHAHFDHIYSAPYFREKYNADIYVSKVDNDLIKDSTKNESDNFSHHIEIENCKTFDDNEILNLLGIKIKCILTPGHTKGSSCFYIENKKLLFSGDTILEHTFGATRFYSGSDDDIVKSLKNVLFKLPDDIMIYPGHGKSSIMSYEKNNNAINFV